MKKYVRLNDRTLAVYFEEVISREINREILVICHELEKLNLDAIKAVQHTYHMLAIHYNPDLMTEDHLKDLISQIDINTITSAVIEKYIRVPVLYDGPDLEKVSTYNQLSKEEVIHIHSMTKYYVYFLGFSAGFPYLGGLDGRIATPRLQTPRIKVSSGSVGIADQQTGIYTVESPGGWNIIGRTPIKIFDPSREESCFIQAGSFVEFYPIDVETFFQLEKGDELD